MGHTLIISGADPGLEATVLIRVLERMLGLQERVKHAVSENQGANQKQKTTRKLHSLKRSVSHMIISGGQVPGQERAHTCEDQNPQTPGPSFFPVKMPPAWRVK